ncbi:hypothetical protein [Pleionea sediminis]|uniref:hypothetical protein n=1 Tax=Pleionea sediminis TaxID=2569479 RepID=UPI001186EEDA|nr:hypothetical protein [Pleionea sediminis]
MSARRRRNSKSDSGVNKEQGGDIDLQKGKDVQQSKSDEQEKSNNPESSDVSQDAVSQSGSVAASRQVGSGPIPKVETYATLKDRVVQSQNIKEELQFLGAGTNKDAYSINDKWVLLVAKEKNESGDKSDNSLKLLQEEASTLKKLREAGIDTPDVGDAEVIVVRIDGKERYAILEEKVNGFEMRGDGTATTDQDVQKFSEKVVADIKDTADPEKKLEKYTNALNSLEKLRDYFDTGTDILDWQVTYRENDGFVLTIDPGQEGIAQNGTAKKDRARVDKLIKDLIRSKDLKDLNAKLGKERVKELDPPIKLF